MRTTEKDRNSPDRYFDFDEPPMHGDMRRLKLKSWVQNALTLPHPYAFPDAPDALPFGVICARHYSATGSDVPPGAVLGALWAAGYETFADGRGLTQVRAVLLENQ